MEMAGDGKEREERNREDLKKWVWEILHKFSFKPSKLGKKYTILDTIYRRKMSKISRELSHTMLVKRIQDTKIQLH